MNSLRLFIKLSRPIYILISILLFVLGTGIARYLSGLVNWASFSLGLAWLVFILLGFQYLNDYFYVETSTNDPKWWYSPFSGSTGAIGPGKLSRPVALWMGLACITISASLTIMIYKNQILDQAVILLLGLILISELVYSIPPFRLVTSGYGEVLLAITMAGMMPAFAFSIQGHAIHRILTMISLPLVLLFLSMLLALEFPVYASAIGHGRKPTLVKIGWQKGVLLHNVLVLGSFIILGVALIFGLPKSIVIPVLFVVPIGLLQIWLINRIADGIKPNWNLLSLVAYSTFILTTYLLSFSFWTH